MMEEEQDLGDNGSGAGDFLAPPRKKMLKKTNLKKALAKGISVKAETRQSVFAKAGMLSARELTRLVEDCSALAKEKADDELAEGTWWGKIRAGGHDRRQDTGHALWVAFFDVRA